MPRDLEHRTWWHLSLWYMLQQLYTNVAQHIWKRQLLQRSAYVKKAYNDIICLYKYIYIYLSIYYVCVCAVASCAGFYAFHFCLIFCQVMSYSWSRHLQQLHGQPGVPVRVLGEPVPIKAGAGLMDLLRKRHPLGCGAAGRLVPSFASTVPGDP